MAEAWIRGPTQSISAHPNLVQWKQDVDALVQTGLMGRSLAVEVKTWAPSTPAQRLIWHKFALASFLLGTDGHAYFEFAESNSPASILVDNPWDRIDVGTPIGAYAAVGAVYRRVFTKGLSIVNPTPNTVVVPLGGIYRTLEGALVTSLHLAPYSGEVLTL
jgi:hypothetical protein